MLRKRAPGMPQGFYIASDSHRASRAARAAVEVAIERVKQKITPGPKEGEDV